MEKTMQDNFALEKVQKLTRLLGYIEACSPERFNEAYINGDLDNFEVELQGLSGVRSFIKRQLVDAEKELNN